MKFLIAVLLLSTTTADRIIWYDYVATSVSGVPGASDNSTGVQITMKVAVTYMTETRAILQVTQCSAIAFIGKYPEKIDTRNIKNQMNIHSFQTELEECNDIKTQCLPFDNFDGHIVNIYPSPQESVRIINMKRGILSALQGMPLREDGTFIEEQTDVLGRCRIEVRKDSTDNEVFLVKRRNTETCPDRSIEFSTILPITKQQQAKFVFGETTTEMKFVREDGYLIMQRSEVTEKQSFAPVSKDAGSAVVTLSQVLSQTNSGVRALSECPMNPLSRKKTLMFEFPAPTCDQQYEDQCQAASIIETMAPLSDPTEIAKQFGWLIEEMRRCSKSKLRQLKNTYAQCKSPDDEELRRKHTFFLDALAWLGTEPALELIKELAMDSDLCLSASRRRELIVSLSMISLHRLCSPCKLLNVTLDIAMYNNENMTSTLVLGAVVNSVQRQPQSCYEEINRSMSWLLKKYRETTNLKEKLHVVKALGNAGSMKGLSVIQDTLWETPKARDELNIERRLAAVYALNKLVNVAPLKVDSIVLPIYYNSSEDVEVRVAAFYVYIHPDKVYSSLKELFELVKSLRTESNRYVRSYVYTCLSQIESSSNPQMQRSKETISYVMKLTNAHYWCKLCDLGYFSSKATHGYASLTDTNLPNSLPYDVMGVGLFTGFTYTDTSHLPRSGVARLSINAFGYDFEALEIGVRALGTYRLIQRLFGPTGYIRLGTRTLNPSGLPGEDKMCYPEKEPMWISGYIKAFGNELAWNRADEEGIEKALYTNEYIFKMRDIVTETIMSGFRFPNLRNIFDALKGYVEYLVTGKLAIAHGSICYIKSASVIDVKRSIPTVLGFPLNLTASAMATSHVDADGDITLEGMTELKAQGEINPRAAVFAKLTIVLDVGKVAPKLVHTGEAMTRFKQAARLSISKDYDVELDIDQMPYQPESVVLEAKYRQYVELSGKRMEMGIWKRNETELYERVGGDLMHIEFITPISYPNSSGVPAAPYFPLSGPAEAKLILRPISPMPSGHQIKFWNKTILCPERGTFYASFAVDGNKTMKAEFDWYTDGEKPSQYRVINLTANSVPAVASGLFLANTSNTMDIEGWMSFNTSISKTWGYVKFNQSKFYGKATRMRINPDNDTVVVKIPEFMAEVNGSLVYGINGNLSAIVYVEDSCDQPQWLRANFTTLDLMVNITTVSSMFSTTNLGYILPYPLKSPTCTYFHHSVITYDGLSYPVLHPECEYVLTRHNNESDNFAVTVKEAGNVLSLYLNGTTYSLSPDGLRVNNREEYMPYKRKHDIYIRQVNKSDHTYVRISAWSGIDIYYGSAGQVQVSIDGFYMNQVAGLCSNANYNNNRDEELQGPCGPVDTVKQFVSSWQINCLSPTAATLVPTSFPNWNSTLDECRELFSAVAHPALDHHSYMEVCIDDVAHGRPANPSIDAYTTALALATKEVALKFNPRCEKKDHETFYIHSKKCKTQKVVTMCKNGCQPVRSTHKKSIRAYCISPNEDSLKKKNVSPLFVLYRPIIRCR